MQVPDVPSSGELDVAVIGAGVAGFAAAPQLAERRPALRVVELDIELTWGSTPSLCPLCGSNLDDSETPRGRPPVEGAAGGGGGVRVRGGISRSKNHTYHSTASAFPHGPLFLRELRARQFS